MNIEEAKRLEDDSGQRPQVVRVKFANLRDRNLVLAASKTTKTRLKVYMYQLPKQFKSDPRVKSILTKKARGQICNIPAIGNL